MDNQQYAEDLYLRSSETVGTDVRVGEGHGIDRIDDLSVGNADRQKGEREEVLEHCYSVLWYNEAVEESLSSRGEQMSEDRRRE
jgi:hypothetical protein